MATYVCSREAKGEQVTIFKLHDGRLINVNEVTGLDHNEDGSIDVYRGGQVTHLSGQNAERFREMTRSDYGRVAEAAERAQRVGLEES
jgi:hypothetical protein